MSMRKEIDFKRSKCRLPLPISSTFYVRIFCTNVILAAFSSCMYVVKASETTFVRKICTWKCWWNWHLVFLSLSCYH